MMPKKNSHLITVNGMAYRWMAWRHDLNVELANINGQRLTVRLLRDGIDPWLEFSKPEELRRKRKPGEMGEIKKQFVARAINQCLKLGWKPEIRAKVIVAQFRQGRFTLTDTQTVKEI